MEQLLNNLAEFTLLGSVSLFYAFTIIFILLLFVSELQENGWIALWSFGIFIILMSWQSNLEPIELLTEDLYLIGYYIAIGLIHSLVRSYIYGRKRKPERLEAIATRDKWFEENPDKTPSGYYHDTNAVKIFDDTTYSKLKGNVFRWWFLWPISLLTWIFSDLLKDVFNFIYDKLKRIFQAVVDAGMK